MPELHLQYLGLDVGYAEGPVISPNGTISVVSIDRGVVYQRGTDEDLRAVRTGGGPNGLVEDHGGRLFVAQNGGAIPGTPERGVSGGVQVIEGESVFWLTQHPQSPNDLAFGPDGWLYVTDPKRIPQRTEGRIWKVHPESGESRLLTVMDWYPNGIGFSTRDDLLFVADTTGRRIVVFDFDEHGIRNPRTWTQISGGPRPDGFAFDVDDNLLVCGVGLEECPSELLILDSAASLIGRATLPQETGFLTNVAIDRDGFVIATESGKGDLLTGSWHRAGLPLHPFR
jgi:gluconolactonase